MDGKIRINVSLSKGTLAKAKGIKKADNRPSVSNVVENLIDREAERLGVSVADGTEQRQHEEKQAA